MGHPGASEVAGAALGHMTGNSRSRRFLASAVPEATAFNAPQRQAAMVSAFQPDCVGVTRALKGREKAFGANIPGR